MACDKTADTTWGMPLLPGEVADLFARNGRVQPVVDAARAYTAGKRDIFGGIYIDQSAGGIVTVLWTEDAESHGAAIRAKLGPGAQLVSRQVRWSENVLRDLQDRIGEDLDWLEAVPARMQGIGVDISENVTTFEVSTSNPNIEALAFARYGVDGTILRVESDGTGRALLPWGTIVGTVFDVGGKRLGENNLSIHKGRGSVGACGGGDMGFGVRPDGTFEYPCQVGTHRIELWDGTESANHTVVGEVTVTVLANTEVRVEVQLTEPLSTSP